jgi:hypothetical protein
MRQVINGLPEKAPAGIYLAWQQRSGASQSVISINDEQYQIGHGKINDLLVFDDTLYACGHYLYHDTVEHVDFDHGFYIKGSNSFELPVTGNPGMVTSLWVHNDSIYIGGQDNGKPCYWLNGQNNSLGNYRGGVNDISVKNGVVYAVGYRDKPPGIVGCYWKDGVAEDLPGLRPFGDAIFVEDQVIYIVGYSEDNSSYPFACYWKNGAQLSLDVPTLHPNQISEATDIYIHDGDVYIAGFYWGNSDGYNYWQMCYWKNGERTDLMPHVPVGSKRPVIIANDSATYIAADTLLWIAGVRAELLYDPASFITAISVNARKHTITATAGEPQNQLAFFPNPAKSEIYFSQTQNERCDITILDLSGREIFKHVVFKNGDPIQLNNMPAGFYILRAERKGATNIFKLQVQ